MLQRLANSLESGEIDIDDHPAWTRDLLKYHIFPEVEVLTNRYLEKGNISMGKTTSASLALERIIGVSPVGSEHSEWARKMKFEIKS